MASTWSALKIELLETGSLPGTWGTATNVNLGDAILGEAITGQATVDFATDADVTITLTDSATTQAARNLRLNITESSTGIGSVRNLILGSGCQIEKFYLINNTGTGAKTVKNTSGTGISVPAGKATLVYNNGTNVVDAASYFSSLTLGSALPVASGGTGLTSTPANGALDIGNGTGFTRTTLTQGSGITITNGSGSITIAATADVVGPASSTDNAFARFDSTTGKLLQNSTGATLSDTGAAVFTGALDVLGNSTAGSNIKLYEDTDNGTNYVSFKAPDTIASNVTWTLPAVDGTSAQVLQTNGSGVLSFATVSGGGSPGGSTTQVQYNNAGAFGGITGATTNGTALTLTGAILNGTIGATTPSTGAFTSVTSSGVTNSFGSATDANVANLFSGTKTGYAMLAVDSSTLSPVATGDAGIVFIQPAVGNTIQKASTGTHANFASLYVPPFSVGAGASTLTNASSIYVPSAPSGATNNYAISVGSGTTYLNGLVDISGASGGQIKFPASQNASANANTLDDYEEGTWTPNIGGNATYYAQTGRYVKIGNTVTLYMYLRPNLVGTGNANGEIYGVPFAANRGTVAVGPPLTVGYYQALGASVTSLVAGMNDATQILLLSQTAAATTNGAINGIMANATQIELSGTYIAN